MSRITRERAYERGPALPNGLVENWNDYWETLL